MTPLSRKKQFKPLWMPVTEYRSSFFNLNMCASGKISVTIQNFDNSWKKIASIIFVSQKWAQKIGPDQSSWCQLYQLATYYMQLLTFYNDSAILLNRSFCFSLYFVTVSTIISINAVVISRSLKIFFELMMCWLLWNSWMSLQFVIPFKCFSQWKALKFMPANFTIVSFHINLLILIN